MKKLLTLILTGSLGFGAGALTDKGTVAFDDKGLTDVRVQVMVKDKNFNDALYYSPTEWNTKTKQQIETEKVARFDNWKRLVEEQSKIDTPIEEVIEISDEKVR